jgi:hypothetical protein
VSYAIQQFDLILHEVVESLRSQYPDVADHLLKFRADREPYVKDREVLQVHIPWPDKFFIFHVTGELTEATHLVNGLLFNMGVEII